MSGHGGRWRVTAGAGLLGGLAFLAILAPVVTPNAPDRQFSDRAYAPPMRIHIRDASGFRLPFVYRQVLENRLARQYREDLSAPLSLQWFAGSLVALAPGDGPLLLMGADALGRDVFSRLLHGARLSLAVALLGLTGALLLGALVGGIAGSTGGATESGLMLVADFLLVLPGAYLILVLRGALPLVLSTQAVFALMSALFALAAWPHAARGVRAIVATERRRETMARAAGACRGGSCTCRRPHAAFRRRGVALLRPGGSHGPYLSRLPNPVASPARCRRTRRTRGSCGKRHGWRWPLFLVVFGVQLIVWTKAPTTELLTGRPGAR
jgi:ABC-type dipeptide/oligopeptide/nickel transport system permease subunit